MLYMLGGVVFELVPTNLDAATRERGQDWAAKAIAGALNAAGDKLCEKGAAEARRLFGIEIADD